MNPQVPFRQRRCSTVAKRLSPGERARTSARAEMGEDGCRPGALLEGDCYVSDVYPQLVDPAFWRLPLGDRMARFAELREIAPFLPATFVNPIAGLEESFYVTTRYAEVLEISRRPHEFCSGRGAVSIRTCPRAAMEFFGSFISMDDPRHATARNRRSVLHPKQLQGVLDSVETICTELSTRCVSAARSISWKRSRSRSRSWSSAT